MKLTLRERLHEWRYWYVSRPIDRLKWRAARLLPDTFRRRIWYTVTADATTSGPLASKEVPSVTINDVMGTFPEHPERSI